MQKEELSGEGSGEEFFEVERAQHGWLVLYFLVALSLWAQWSGLGAWTEIESEDGSAAILALHLLPLAALALALGWNEALARLFVFPVSFLPGMLLVTEMDRARLMEPLGLGLGLASFGLYLVIASSRPKASGLIGATTREVKVRLKDRYAEGFRRELIARILGLGMVGAMITYGLFIDPEIGASLARLQGESGGEAQHLFMVVLLYFTWMIAVYMAGILPVLNWEYERRQPALSPGERRLLRSPSRLRRRVLVWLGLLFLVIPTTVWMLGSSI